MLIMTMMTVQLTFDVGGLLHRCLVNYRGAEMSYDPIQILDPMLTSWFICTQTL